MTKSPFDRVSQDIALTFDDVLLVPAASAIMPGDALLTTRLSKNIALNIPLISAAMDTVTETKMAIAMAQLGGIGVIHRNMSAAKQAEKIRTVKRFQARVVRNVITIAPETTIVEALEAFQRYGIAEIPVIDVNKVLVGLASKEVLEKSENPEQAVGDIMSKNVLTVKSDTDINAAYTLIKEKNARSAVVVDKNNHCVGMINWGDKEKFEKFPNACTDANGALRVAAAVGVGEAHFERIEQLIDEGVDAIIVDTAHGHSKAVSDMVTHIRRQRAGHIDVIAGNIATSDAALALIDAGADAVKVGVGPGSICTTRVVAGVGVPQITAIMNAADACLMHNIPVIADGGMRMSSDLVKALAAGASCVMMGSLLAGTDESPGDVVEVNGKKMKSYRGMGSSGAMNEGSADRYGQAALKAAGRKLTPEGVEAYVAYKGPVSDVIDPLIGGIRAGMGYTGCKTIDELRSTPRFVRITNAGLRESHPHSLEAIKA